MVGSCSQQPADSKAGEAATHGARRQRASLRLPVIPNCCNRSCDVGCWEQLRALQVTANPVLMTFNTNAHTPIHAQRKCLQLNRICHIEFGVKTSTHLAASRVSVHSLCSGHSFKQGHFSVTLQLLRSIPAHFSPWQVTQKSSARKMH